MPDLLPFQAHCMEWIKDLLFIVLNLDEVRPEWAEQYGL